MRSGSSSSRSTSSDAGGRLLANSSAWASSAAWPCNARTNVEPPCPSLRASAMGLPSNMTVAVKHSVSSLAKSATLRFLRVMRSCRVMVSMGSPDIDRVDDTPLTGRGIHPVGWRKVASMPGGQRSPERCRGELAGGVGGTHGSLDTLAAGCCRCVGNAGGRIARPAGRVLHQSEAIDPVLCRYCTSRRPQPRDAQHGHGIADRLAVRCIGGAWVRDRGGEADCNVGGHVGLPFVWRRAIALAGALKGRRKAPKAPGAFGSGGKKNHPWADWQARSSLEPSAHPAITPGPCRGWGRHRLAHIRAQREPVFAPAGTGTEYR